MLFYNEPRKVVYLSETGIYDIQNGGWQRKEVETTVIGEDNDSFIEHYKVMSCGYWDELGRYTAHYCTPMGFHKSRFVRWVDGVQLSLFPIVSEQVFNH